MVEKGETMRNKRAARYSCSYNRAFVSVARDIDTIAEFERASWLGALVLGVAFGLMFFVGLM